MYRPVQFLEAYRVDHYFYKVVTLKSIIDNYEQFKPSLLATITDLEDSKYIDTLRAEIRATCYSSIETLFELIFALLPRGGRIYNEGVWYFLSNSNWRTNFDRIQEIANGDTAFLDLEVVAGKRSGTSEDLVIPMGEYLFYFGLSDVPAIKAHIPQSLESIRRFLVIIAKEFVNRDEYNALKHSMRIFPTVKDLKYSKTGREGDWHPLLDMSGSMSYLKEEKDGSLSVYVVPMDTTRDANLTMMCSQLISNIVLTRRRKFVERSDKQIKVFALDERTLENLSKRNTQPVNLRFNVKPTEENESEE